MTDNAMGLLLALRRAAQEGGLPGDSCAVAFPLREAQRMELDGIVRAIEASDPDGLGVKRFARGEAVRWIRRTGPMRPETTERMLMVFWCPLVAGDPWHAALMAGADHAERKTLARADCLVAFLAEGVGLMFQLVDSSLLERDVGGDAVA